MTRAVLLCGDVIDVVAGRGLGASTVVVSSGLIESVTAGHQETDGALDLRDATLVPGLIDSHVHLNLRADGRPHTTPLVGVWNDGGFAFCTGVGEQKHRNLEHSVLVTVTTGSNTWQAGTDVVVEGSAVRVLGRERLQPLADAWVRKYGEDWAWGADDDGFTDGDGTQPWVYVVPPAKVIAFGKEPHSQTTYRPGAS